MGPIAKCAAAASSLLFVACASIAGVEDPGVASMGSATGTGPSNSSSETRSDDGSDKNGELPLGNDAGTEEDANAAPSVSSKHPPPEPKEDGQACSSADECSSNACGQGGTCVATCETSDVEGTCTGAADTTTCCVGMFCGNTGQCLECKPGGVTIPFYYDDAHPFGAPNSRACCSGKFKKDGPFSYKCL